MEDRGSLYDRARDRLIAHLSRVQIDVDRVRGLLAAIEKTQTVPPAADLTSVAESAERLRKQTDLLTEPLTESAQLDALAGGQVQTVRDAVEAALRDVSALNPQTPPADAAAARAAALLAKSQLDKVFDETLDLIVPYEVGELLHARRVGRSLEFAEVFLPAEPPTAERRTELLTVLERSGSYLDEGVVDVKREIIWRKSANPAVRILGAFSPVFFAVLTGLLLIGLSSLPALDDNDALGNNSEVIQAYLIVLAGAVANLLVENVKQSQAKDAPILAIGEFVDWLHLRWAGIGSSFFFILVTVIGLRLTLKLDLDKDGWDAAVLYFFGGYSVDSVAGIFLTRFGTTAKSGVASLKTAIGG